MTDNQRLEISHEFWLKTDKVLFDYRLQNCELEAGYWQI
jgi:hypothetical protein